MCAFAIITVPIVKIGAINEGTTGNLGSSIE